MASIGTGLALTDGELDELLTTSWNMRVATVGPDTRINVTPLWFGWAGGAVYFYCRGQKIVNLRRNPVCTVLVDRNERFPELEGAMLQGEAQILETADDEAADQHLDEVRRQMGAKYAGGHGDQASPAEEASPADESPRAGEAPRAEEAPAPFAASARGRSWRWVRFAPAHVVTWDNHKIGR